MAKKLSRTTIVRRHRVKAGLTIEAAARKVGCTVGTMYRYETGRLKVGGRYDKQVCKALGIDPADLLREQAHDAA